MSLVKRSIALVFPVCGALAVAGCERAAVVEASPKAERPVRSFVAGDLIRFSGEAGFPNGAWSWFQDPRVVVDTAAPDGPLLLVSSFSAREVVNDPRGDLPRGDNDLYWLNLKSGEKGSVKLHSGLVQDDHNAGAITILEDGRYLIAYADHGREDVTYVRRSRPHDPHRWDPVTTYDNGDAVTYSNLYRLGGRRDDETIYNFSRSIGWDPNAFSSEDGGRTWQHAGRLFNAPGRPYTRYAQGDGTVHFISTEQHPRDFDNSIYHGSTDGAALVASDGTVIDGDMREGGSPAPEDFTRVYQGSPDSVAWTVDIEVDREQSPYIVFSTQNDGKGMRSGTGGLDHRYHYARWDGERWQVHEIAHAGSHLYSREADYTGLAALDPNDPDRMVISTNAHPVTGEPLLSAMDGQRHWELFAGITEDAGATWTWTPITENSRADNIRPVIPEWDGDKRAVLWMRGNYRTYMDWDTHIVGLVEDR